MTRVLVIQGSTETFHPGHDPADLAAQRTDDPEAAVSELDGHFRADMCSAFGPELVAGAVRPGITEVPYFPTLPNGTSVRDVCFFDAAGGGVVNGDSCAAYVAGPDSDGITLKAGLEIRPPFSAEEVVAQVAALCKQYRITHVEGDRYAGIWPRDALAKHGIGYVPSELPASQIYLECIPLFTSHRVRLLDHPRLIRQLLQLERRVRPGGRDEISHPRNRYAHDDLAIAGCGALLRASRSAGRLTPEQFASAVLIEPLRVLDEYHDVGGGPYLDL